jgi:hypothetical protein
MVLTALMVLLGLPEPLGPPVQPEPKHRWLRTRPKVLLARPVRLGPESPECQGWLAPE